MATNVINIRQFVDVSTAVASSGTDVTRDWGAFLFVQKGADEAATTVTKYDDLAAVQAGAGSNSEAAKAAAIFYGTSYNGVSPTSPCYVAIISASDAADFTANFTPLVGSEEYYLICLDKNFTAAMQESAASIVEAGNADAAHKLFLDDGSANAVDLNLEDDLASGTPSVSAYCGSHNFAHTVVAWHNPANTNPYYSAAIASFFATRQFNTSSRRMCSIAFKKASGIDAVNFLDAGLNSAVSGTTKFQNLDAKHANVYANIKIVGLPAWERGNASSGDDISDFVSADYLNYTMTMAIFNLLQTTPRVPMNQDGARMLATTIASSFDVLVASGVIAPGTSVDGEVFGGSGYKYSIPTPSAAKKANGIWDGIVCSALLAGSCKKVVITNDLKK